MYILEFSTWKGSMWGHWVSVTQSDNIEELEKRINEYIEIYAYNFRVRIITIIREERSF